MKRALVWPLLLAGMLSFLVACTSRPTGGVTALSYPPLHFKIPETDKLILPGGIHLYLKEDHELPLVEVTALVGAGDIDDPVARTGQGRLFAALLRTGGAGERGPEAFDDELERLAADLSVSTDSYATTCELSLRSSDLDSGLGLLADLLRRPRFDAERLELARRQAIEGLRRQNDLPAAIAQRILRRAIYGNHPLGRTPTIATLEAVRRKNLVAFHDRYFTPDNLWLAISGDFRRDELLAALNRVFGDWQAGPAPRQELPPLSQPSVPALWLASKPVPQTTLLAGEVGIDKDAPDLQAVQVMNWILGGGGFNSRLLREVRSDRGLAYSVYSSFQIGRRLPGSFIVGTETKSGTTLQVFRLLREEMDKMRREPVTPAELALAKESLINSFVFAFADPHEVVSRQLRLDFYGYPADFLQRYRERIATVSAAEVLQAAKDHLHPEQQAWVVVGNPAAFDGDPATLGLPVKNVVPEAGENR